MKKQILLLVLSVAHFAPSVTVGDDITALDLSANQKAAASIVTEGRVLSTVSFLSSDEMAGRNTPSKELRIASAYVAARFRGAGLEPLGDDDTFFDTDVFRMTQPPAKPPAVTTTNGQPVEILGTLCGPPEDLDLNRVQLHNKDTVAEKMGEVVLASAARLPPGSAGKPSLAMAAISRSVNALAKQGVKLVLIRASRQSPLVEVARTLQSKPIPLNANLHPRCGVLLVDEDAELAEKHVSISCSAQRLIEAPVRNVVGVLRGSDEKLSTQAVIISAHLDHIGLSNRTEDSVNNGADDNASGVTAVLSLADAYCALNPRPKRSVIFTTFWGEEKGLLGARAFVQKPPWSLDDIVANVNIEMVGRPEKDAREKIWMTGWKHSNLGSLMNAGAARIGVEVFDRKDVGEMLYTRSDNFAFVKVGVVAHSFSAGSLHSDYHQPSDEWPKLDIPHMTKVIQGLFAGTLYLADGSLDVNRQP